MKTTQSAGGIVINSKTKKILVVNQNNKSWSLPKGHIDPGETALTAAKREIEEESGITELKLVKQLGTYQRYKIGKNPEEDDKSELKVIHMFLFTTNQEKLDPKDKDNPKAKWIEKDKVANLLTHKKDKQFFNDVLMQF